MPYFQKNKILYLSQLTVDCIKNLIKHIKSQNTKHKTYILLNMLFKYAIKKGIHTENPLLQIKKPPEKIKTVQDDEEENYIESENQEMWLEIFEKENTDMSLLFETILLTGIRPEEACGLRWTNLDIEKNHLVVDNAFKSFNIYNEDRTKVIGHKRMDSTLKTPDSYRKIPLTPRLKKVLLEHKKSQQELFKTSRAIKSSHRKWSENEYIFLGRNYHPYVSESLAYGLRKIRAKYNIERKVTPYGLRRSFATLCAEKNMKPIILMKLMGHVDYNTTQLHYIKISEKQKQKAIQETYNSI